MPISYRNTPIGMLKSRMRSNTWAPHELAKLTHITSHCMGLILKNRQLIYLQYLSYIILNRLKTKPHDCVNRDGKSNLGKNTQWVRNRRILPRPHEGHPWKTAPTSSFGQKDKAFPSRSGTWQGCLLPYAMAEVLIRDVRWGKKRVCIGKEQVKPLCSGMVSFPIMTC